MPDGRILTIVEKLEAVREWVDTGIGESLEEDPSGFMLGVASLGVLAALDEALEVLRGD